MGSVSKIRKKQRYVGGSARYENRKTAQKPQTFLQRILNIDNLKRCCGLEEEEVKPNPFQITWDDNSQTSSRSRLSSYDLLDMSMDSRISLDASQRGRKTLSFFGNYQGKYALKSIHLNRIDDEVIIEEMRNEISIMKTLDHPNIVRPIETFNFRSQLFIVMELCSGGDLYCRDPYTEEQAKSIINDIVSAVAYMHRHNITHRGKELSCSLSLISYIYLSF